jgi:putative transposase
MKKSRFTEQQIAFALQQAEAGTSVDEVCRKMGICQATFFRWKKVYGGLMPSEVRKLKQLEEENARLRKLVADLTLDKEMLSEVIRKVEDWRREYNEVRPHSAIGDRPPMSLIQKPRQSAEASTSPEILT